MRRWWLIPRNRWFNVYLHQILHDDEDRALHDHPYANCSIVLRGGYVEVTPKGRFLRRPSAVRFRLPTAAHRLELRRDEAGNAIPSWSLFITGPRVREWGFHCPRGWVHWKLFTSPTDIGQIGRGCDQ